MDDRNGAVGVDEEEKVSEPGKEPQVWGPTEVRPGPMLSGHPDVESGPVTGISPTAESGLPTGAGGAATGEEGAHGAAAPQGELGPDAAIGTGATGVGGSALAPGTEVPSGAAEAAAEASIAGPSPGSAAAAGFPGGPQIGTSAGAETGVNPAGTDLATVATSTTTGRGTITPTGVPTGSRGLGTESPGTATGGADRPVNTGPGSSTGGIGGDRGAPGMTGADMVSGGTETGTYPQAGDTTYGIGPAGARGAIPTPATPGTVGITDTGPVMNVRAGDEAEGTTLPNIGESGEVPPDTQGMAPGALDAGVPSERTDPPRKETE